MGLLCTVLVSLVVCTYARADSSRDKYLDRLRALNDEYNSKRGALEDSLGDPPPSFVKRSYDEFTSYDDQKGSKVSAVKFDIAACIRDMNMFRHKLKGTPNLIWDKKLAKGSEEWAMRLAKESLSSGHFKFYHSTSKQRDGAVENIYWGILMHAVTCHDANKAWFSEIKDFDFVKGGPKPHKGFHNIGHFTQMEWKDTKKFGIGIARGNFGKYWNLYGLPQYFVVGRYIPAGNNGTPFAKEIGAP